MERQWKKLKNSIEKEKAGITLDLNTNKELSKEDRGELFGGLWQLDNILTQMEDLESYFKDLLKRSQGELK